MPETKRNSIPKISGFGGKLFKRSSVLNGEIKSFYSPGQLQSLQFTNPTDWMEPGSLLRVPQVVWLNKSISGSNSPIASVFINYKGTPDHMDMNYVMPATIADAAYAENTRLDSVFSEVESRIASIRPGRTWVSRWEWYNSPQPFGSQTFDGYVQCPAPAQSDSPFVGTDFLNIWCGELVINTEDMNSFTDGKIPDSIDDPYVSGFYSRVKSAFDMFRGYGVKLYKPSGEWNNDYTIVDPPGANYPSWSFIQSQVANGMTELVPPSWAEDHQASYNGYGSAFDYFESILGEQGVSNEGETADLTAESLMELIASHYGFDPDTGLDIPDQGTNDG